MYICTNKLRWVSYRTKGSEGENLPPTRGAIVQHFRRAWLAAVIRKSCTTPTPTIPLPKDNGYYKEEERLRPVTSLILLAPASIIELVKCSCKGECLKKRVFRTVTRAIYPATQCANVKICARTSPKGPMTMV